VDFVEICNVCARKAIIEAAKRIINSDEMCRSYSDLNFGVTFFGTQCILNVVIIRMMCITMYQLEMTCLFFCPGFQHLESPDFFSKISRTWKVLEMSLVPEMPGIYLWFNLTNMPFMYRTPCVKKCMKYSRYVLTEHFLQLVTNILRWIVLSHCIYKVSNCYLSVT